MRFSHYSKCIIQYICLQDQVTYNMTGVGLAPEYFTIESNTGIIKIRKSLKNDTLKTSHYLVSVYIC